jgi:hypothetical protein
MVNHVLVTREVRHWNSTTTHEKLIEIRVNLVACSKDATFP